MGGSETAQQPDKQLNERCGIGRQHVSDGCVTDAVSQCHSVRACPSANGHSSSFGMLLPINEECRFDELLVRFRRWVGQSNKNGKTTCRLWKRMEQRCGRSNWETLLASMPSVFPLQPSCHVAYCSSDSWSPQSRSLLAWNLCNGYKRVNHGL